MRIFTHTHFLVFAFSIALGLFLFLFIGKPGPKPPMSSLSTQGASTSRFHQEAEARRVALLEDKSKEERLTKLKNEKANSIECQFWKQQKKEKSSERVDEKITTFCELTANNPTNSAPTTSEPSLTSSLPIK